MSAPTEPELSSPARVAAYLRGKVTETFKAETAARQADRDPTVLSISGLGGCTRAGAYALAGTPASDVPPLEEARQANLGTWEHDGFLPRFAKISGAQYEQALTLRAHGVEIHGHADLTLTPGLVIDFKTAGQWRLKGARKAKDGAYFDHIVQVLAYAVAYFQAGNDVRYIAFIYMDRASGEEYIKVIPFTNAAVMAVFRRVERLKWFAERNPDAAPREMAEPGKRLHGPGKSFACDRCPWLRRCWGPTAKAGEVGAQRELARTDAGTEWALGLYRTAADARADAERDVEFAKMILDRAPVGRYGRRRLRRGKPGMVMDQERVRHYFEARGIPVPMKATSGRLLIDEVPDDADVNP